MDILHQRASTANRTRFRSLSSPLWRALRGVLHLPRCTRRSAGRRGSARTEEKEKKRARRGLGRGRGHRPTEKGGKAPALYPASPDTKQEKGEGMMKRNNDDTSTHTRIHTNTQRHTQIGVSYSTENPVVTVHRNPKRCAFQTSPPPHGGKQKGGMQEMRGRVAKGRKIKQKEEEHAALSSSCFDGARAMRREGVAVR